jgi:hypothetical protein
VVGRKYFLSSMKKNKIEKEILEGNQQTIRRGVRAR